MRLYGPARTRDAIDCTGEPAAKTTYNTGAGPSMTPVLHPARTGWYGYQLVIPSSDDVIGLTTPCGEASELLKVEAQPTVKTQVSAPAVDPGAAITDTALVEGLGGETVTVVASLYGPYAAADKITCAGAAGLDGLVRGRSADGSYVTEPVTLTVPGYYTYRESIAASEFVRPVQTPCAETAETTIVRGHPQITTQVSAQETAPGASITDSVAVSGLGALSATVNVELWGPFPTREAIRCEGTPLATSTLTATGDGTYTSAPTTLDRAGYYTYRESIAATDALAAPATACGEVSETTFARATPAVTTVVSNQVVRPGARIFDRIRVTGLGRTPAQVEVRLFGPFASRAAMRCDGAPLWKGTVSVTRRRRVPLAAGPRAALGLLHVPRADRRHADDRRGRDRMRRGVRDLAGAAAHPHRPRRSGRSGSAAAFGPSGRARDRAVATAAPRRPPDARPPGPARDRRRGLRRGHRHPPRRARRAAEHRSRRLVARRCGAGRVDAARSCSAATSTAPGAGRGRSTRSRARAAATRSPCAPRAARPAATA